VKKSRYLLPCLHEICSDCLNDLDVEFNTNANSNSNSKYLCIECHEVFDLDIVKTNDLFRNINNDESLKRKEFINNLIITTTKLIEEINLTLKNLIAYRIEIKDHYEKKIGNDIENISFYYIDLKDQLLNQKNTLQNADLKQIDLEIESIEFLLARYNKFILMINSINIDHYITNNNFDKIINFVDYVKLPEFIKKSSVRKRIFDKNINEIIYEPVQYQINNANDLTQIPYNTTNLYVADTYVYKENFKDLLPNSVTHITLGWLFDQHIKDCIPITVTHLTCDFNINADFIPSINFITHLTITDCYNSVNVKDIIAKLNYLTHLKISNCFDLQINNCLFLLPTKSITHLIIHFHRNLKDFIPKSVTHLTLYFCNWGCNDQNIKDCIPNSVTHLTLGDSFNHDIKGCIPNSVTHLTFGDSFNQDIKQRSIFGSYFKKDYEKDFYQLYTKFC
jgi:hypothetical protein